jgi:hypothetical protein
MAERNTILAPVSAGELVDKLTILRIKSARITDTTKLENVHREMDQLEAIAGRILPELDQIEPLVADLAQVNGRLWQVEDDIRQCEACGDFGPQFVELARSVYRLNDQRADLKRRINEHVGSPLVEEKQYSQYGRPTDFCP